MFEKDLFGGNVTPQKQGGVLSDNWEYPPFSVLNAREGWWQERKRQWLSLGIKSELGRGAAVSADTPGDGSATGGADMGRLAANNTERAKLLQAFERNGTSPGGGGKTAIYRKGPGFRYAK